MEAGGLSRGRGQVRFGENGNKPLRRQSVDRGIDWRRAPAQGQTQLTRRGNLATRDREIRVERRFAKRLAPIDAERFQHGAAYFGDLDPKIDLVRGGDRELVDDFALGLIGDRRCQRGRPLGASGGRDVTFQDQRAIDRLDRHILAGDQRVQRLPQPRHIVFDADRRIQQHIIIGVDGIEHRLAGRFGIYVDQRRRFYLHVGDLGIGDEHRSRRPWQADQRALAGFQQDRRALGPHLGDFGSDIAAAGWRGTGDYCRSSRNGGRRKEFSGITRCNSNKNRSRSREDQQFIHHEPLDAG